MKEVSMYTILNDGAAHAVFLETHSTILPDVIIPDYSPAHGTAPASL
jgi:hypothetical protein